MSYKACKTYSRKNKTTQSGIFSKFCNNNNSIYDNPRRNIRLYLYFLSKAFANTVQTTEIKYPILKGDVFFSDIPILLVI